MRQRRVWIWLVVLLFVLAGQWWIDDGQASASGISEESMPQEVIVQFSKSAHLPPAERADWLRELGLEVNQQARGESAWLVQLPPGEEGIQAAARLEASAEVAYIQPNYRYELTLQPNDPYYADRDYPQWGMGAIQVNEVWQQMGAGDFSEVRVAVIDSGVDRRHPDLQGSVAWNLGTNTLESGATIQDEHGHGTHVTGVIAATVNNRTGIAGIAGFPFVQVIPVKAMDDEGVGYSDSIARGIDYALEQEVSVINLSIGGEEDDRIIREAVRKAVDQGVLVVAAAGNNGQNVQQFTPGNVDEALTVGAVDDNQNVADFSNYGDTLDVVAPGVSIVSTYPVGEGRLDEDYEVMSGTSVATPFVAGTAALMKAVYPELTAEQMVDIFYQTSLDLEPGGWDTRSGYGLLQVQAALQKAEELKELAANQPAFHDIAESGVALEINALARDGIVSGFGDGTFRPALPVTRAQFAKILTLSAGWEPASATAQSVFQDVTVPEQRQYVGALVREGVTTGVTPELFDPYGKMTRQQMASFFVRAMGWDELAAAQREKLLPRLDFTDQAEIDESHLANVALAAEIGFITGVPNGDGSYRFEPRTHAKRQHVARLGYEFKYNMEQYEEGVAALTE